MLKHPMITFKINNMIYYLLTQWDGEQVRKEKKILNRKRFLSLDTGLVIMKELIDLIKPNILVQLRSSSPHFRHIMPDINPQWSLNAPVSNIYRQMNRIPLNYAYNEFDYNLFVTSVHQHHRGKANLTRQACLWSYFAQLETKQSTMKSLIDYSNHIQILSFEKIGVGLLHREIEPKYLLQVLNGAIVALCRVKHDMVI